MKNKLYLHTAPIGSYVKVFNEIAYKICKSKLQDYANVEVHCNEEFYENVKFFKILDNSVFRVRDQDFLNHEFFTLVPLQEYANQHDCFLCYTHLKGVTRNSETVDDWRRLMTHFVIERWEVCTELLASGYDTVGVNLHKKPFLHYSGNFWWARSKYLKTLKKLQLPSSIGYTNQLFEMPEYRYEAEMWVNSNNPKSFCLHESGVNHYHQPYKESNYKVIQ